MPKSDVSARDRARMLMSASASTRVTSSRRPALFSRKMEICSAFIMRFGPFLLFSLVWVVAVYNPVCHWVWGNGGWLKNLGVLDFAGGLVVHLTCGAAALAAVLVTGARKDHGKHQIVPHNLPMTLLGTGLLWFGWFGFNAGSALAADGVAVGAFAATHLGGMFRLRSALGQAIHAFFAARGFSWVHTPILTGSDCEGAGEMFRVTALTGAEAALPAAERAKQDFFGQDAYLTVSGQLSAEALACALGRVYTFGPTFRAEHSDTSRHGRTGDTGAAAATVGRRRGITDPSFWAAAPEYDGDPAGDAQQGKRLKGALPPGRSALAGGGGDGFSPPAFRRARPPGRHRPGSADSRASAAGPRVPATRIVKET